MKIAKYLLIVVFSISIAFNSYALEQDTFAPDFTLKSNTGENIRLSDLRGQVVMVNFWTTWCGPCRQQMPIAEALYQRYNELGFIILGINIDSDSDGTKNIVKNLGITYPILFDEDDKVSKSYNVSTMPSVFFINRAGKLSNLQRGFRMGDEKRYKKIIRGLLRE